MVQRFSLLNYLFYSMYNQLIRSRRFYLINLTVICFFLSVFIFLFSCHSSPVEHYGFITRLGADTIAVENITRQGDIVTSDEGDRFPRVRLRHTVIDLNADGSIRHLVMDIHTPSEAPDQRERKVIVDVTADKV